MSKNSLVKTLMSRDGLTESEAKKQVANAREALLDAVSCGDYDGAEDIMAYDLGLEMDYIFDLI